MGLFKKNNTDAVPAKKELWSKEDEKYFFERYMQFEHNRPEYLIDQAYNLYVQNALRDISVYDAVLRVLDRYHSDFRDDKTVRAAALYLTGRVYKDRGNIDKMFDFLKRAADAEIEIPDKIVGAGIDYAEQVIKHGRDDLLSEAEKYVSHYYNDKLESPLLIYHVSAILAVIAEKNRDSDKQRYYKKRAETALNEVTSIDKKLRYVKIIKVKDMSQSLMDKIRLFMIENGFELVELNETVLWQKKCFASYHNVIVEPAFDIIAVIASVMYMQTAFGPWIEVGVEGITGSTTKRPLRKTMEAFEKMLTNQ